MREQAILTQARGFNIVVCLPAGQSGEITLCGRQLGNRHGRRQHRGHDVAGRRPRSCPGLRGTIKIDLRDRPAAVGCFNQTAIRVFGQFT